MNLIVYDLEWNNASRARLETFGDYHKCPNEIIEIGAVKLNENFEITDSFSTCIKPIIYGSSLDKRLTEEYNFNYEELEKGLPFSEAINNFRHFIGEDYLLCTWGTDDMVQLKTNCIYFNIDTKWIKKSLNVQKCYMKQYNICENQQISLENAVKEQLVPIDMRFHRALNDSIMTAKLFKYIKKSNIKKPQFLYEESAYRPKVHADITALKLDKTKFRVQCPSCGRYLKALSTELKHNKIEKVAYCSRCEKYIRHRTKVNVYNDGAIEYRSSNILLPPEIEGGVHCNG